MKKNIHQFLFPLLILVFTITLLFPLFTNQLLYADDAELHAARIANYYLAIKQHQFPPRLAPNLDSGYGYPIFNFAYPLPYVISTIFYIIFPISIVLSLNLTIIFFAIVGTLGIYYLAKQFSLSSWQSALVAWLYLTAPYSLINIYSRVALGEISFFADLPWVMWAVENFINKKETKPIHTFLLTLSFAILLISHQTSLLLVLPILIIYYGLRIKNKKQFLTLIKRTAPSAITAILLTIWYWLPALLEKKYVILDRADTITNYLSQFPSGWNFFFHQLFNLNKLNVLEIVSIGYGSWIIFLLSLWALIKNKTTNKNVNYYLLGANLLVVALMMPSSKFIWLKSILSNYIQYPWRLLFLTNILTVLLSINLLQIKLFKNIYWLSSAIITAGLCSIFVYAQPRGFQDWSDYELLEYFKTTTTFNEFQTIWSAKYIRHFPEEKISFRIPGRQLYENEVIQPTTDTKLEILNWTGSKMTYSVTTNQPIEVIQKTAYFPGWELIIDENLQPINYQDEEFPGHITYNLEEGKHRVAVKFTQNTPARKIGSVLFWIGLVSLLIMLL